MAQSAMKSPIGVPLFWESGENPTNEWQTWFCTFKMAVMAKENMNVDLLLRLRPTANGLFYPIMPTLEERIENTSEEDNRKREIRNERRKVDWENECKQIRSKGPVIDRYTWDEADLKVKSPTYLSLGTEATRIFHQRSPHTVIDRCSTNELIYELGLTFTRPRNLTFDRFQLITVQQKLNESLETFFSRLRELGSKAALGSVEEDNTTIQMELLSKVRTAAQVLNFALSRERGQENQKEILRSSAPNWNSQVNAITNKNIRPTSRTQQQSTQQSNKTNEQCWRCGGSFTAGHKNQCTAKQAVCNICKKTGHSAKMCRSKISPLPARRQNQRGPVQRPQGQSNQLKVRQIQEQLIEQEEEKEEEGIESVDPESALYIKELSGDWADINHITPESFIEVQNVHLNTIMPKFGNYYKQSENTVASGHRIPKEFYQQGTSKQNYRTQSRGETSTIHQPNKIQMFQQQQH